MRAEGHGRIAAPVYALTFPMIGLAFLFAGEFSRRARIWRLGAAGLVVVAVKMGEIGWLSLAKTDGMAVVMLYVNALVPLAIASWFVVVQRARRPRRQVAAREAVA